MQHQNIRWSVHGTWERWGGKLRSVLRNWQLLSYSRKIPAYNGTKTFTTAYRRFYHWFWLKSQIHSTRPHFTLRSILILSFDLRLILPSCLFHSVLIIKTLMHFFSLNTCYMPYIFYSFSTSSYFRLKAHVYPIWIFLYFKEFFSLTRE